MRRTGKGTKMITLLVKIIDNEERVEEIETREDTKHVTRSGEKVG